MAVSLPDNPLISVILPVYNGERFVRSAIHSVLRQRYPNLELIVVNDGSTDGTLEVLQTVDDPRLRIVDQPNQGVVAARNNGFARARGEYIAFIDADDAWFPEKLAIEMETVRKYGTPVCIVYSWYYAVDEENRLVNLSPPFREKGNIFTTVLHKESVILPSTALLHREVFEKVDGFSRISEACHLDDRPFFLRACKLFPAFPTEKRLVVYRQAMSGRCRSVLSDYEKACKSEFLILDALQAELSGEELAVLRQVQTKSLFYRFLMYDFMDEARLLYPKICPQTLAGDKKGLLARWSMRCGINFLFVCRLLIQAFTRYALWPWWRLKVSPVYQPV
jgi:glycosyltransferase involved in cell wall biosynthesis